MNLDSLSFTLSQISYLVANISKKNLKQSTQELTNLVLSHGLEADRHLLRCLFSHIDLTLEGTKKSNGNSKDCLQIQLLIQECANLLSKPTLISHFCHAVDNPLHHQKTLKPTPHFFGQLRKILKLTPVQEVVFGLALLHSSNPEFQKLSAQFTRQKLPDLIGSYIDAENSTSRQQEGGLHDTTPEVLHLILTSLAQDKFSISVESKTIFWKRLQRDFPREHVPVILAPLLYPYRPDLPMEKVNQETTIMANNLLENSLPDLIMEMGYNFCSTIEDCKNNLINFGARDLPPATVARIITMMIRSHTGLGDQITLQSLQNPPSYWGNDKNDKNTNDLNHPTTWNIENFVQAVKELSPNISWRDVLSELDNPDFIIKDRHGFNLLFAGIRLFFDGPFQPFPIDLFYRKWKNTDGQYSLIMQILKNPDTFSFADYPYHSVSIDILKATPETDNKEITTWRSLDLIEILLYLSDRGLYTQVQELFKFPIQHCPDVLVLGLLQIQPPLTVLRQELLTNLMPIFLGNHPNSAIILHHAWHYVNISIRPIIMHAMAEWYLRGDNDQTRLSRILDVAQDLKALSLLLNAQSFPFVIDLACLASRRGYLKLDKWLTDKSREHGEPFVSACVKFLQRRCPQIMGNVKEENIPKAAQLPHETLATMLAVLQVCARNVSQELSDAILAMVANCSLLLNNTRQPPPNVLRHRGLDQAFNPFPTPPVDTITNLGSSLAGISIGMATPSSSTFNLPASMGSLVSTPGSPSRLIGAGPSQSPFPMIPLGSALQHPVGAPQVVPSAASLVNVNTIGALARLPQPGVEKAPTPNLFAEMSQNFSKEVEDEANSYFQRIYNHPPHPTLTIEEVLEMLKKFMDSQNKREREVFNCMLKNLFEEYRFFPQYPDKELHITAQLFGGIIERGLMTNFMILGLALRFVLDALRKPYGSKMYFFGIAALDRFKFRLKEYQKYCEHVANIPHFSDFPAHLIEYVEYGLQSQEPPNRPQGPVLPSAITSILQQSLGQSTTVFKTITTTTLTTTSTVSKVTTTASLPPRPSIANATNIDTLLVATEKEEKMTAPPDAMQDKVAFIFNNLSQLNLQSKCDELRELVTEEYWPWMSQYLVMKRASIELNFHVLYSNFLDVLKIPEVNRMVLRETYRNIKVLLRSDKGIANFSDRSLLKNLGHWLGMLTLGRNQPILFIDIDLKSLLVEAYHKGQQELLYVVPFVAKVLESCSKSRIFRPTNPWTMAIMNLLAELHREPDLKLNLKFEIEVLCKNLDIDVTKLKPAGCLKDPKQLEKMEHQLSHPNKKIDNQQTSAPQPQVQTTAQNNILSNTDEISNTATAAPSTSVAPTNTTPMSNIPPGPPEPRFNYMDLNVSSVSNLTPHITINNQLPLIQAHPHLKQLIRSAVEQAVQEWIHLVVERSIKIAVPTCEHVVKQDFAVDPDESRMRLAAHHMVRNLTAGMALITCRDHMLSSISANLKTTFANALQGATPQQRELADSVATSIAEDNMELACAFIQKAAIEKAIPEIDKRLMSEYELRKLARNEGRRYCDSQVLTYQAERMPEQIRLKVGGVNSQRMIVYDVFARNIPGFLPLSDRDTALFIPKPVSQESHGVTPFQTATPAPFTYQNDDMNTLYDKLAAELELYVQNVIATTGGIGTPNPHVAAMHGLREALIHAKRSRDPTSALALLQKAVEGLVDGGPQLDTDMTLRFRDAHLRVLKTLQDPRMFGVQWTNKHVTRCLMECRDELRNNLEAVDCLIRAGLVNAPQLNSLLEVMRNTHDPTTLTDLTPAGPLSNIHSGIMQVRQREYDDPQGFPEKTDFLLRDWVSGYISNSRDPSNFNMFIRQMNYHGILKTDELITKFFRISTQLCVEMCYRCLSETPNSPMVRSKCFHTLDAFVKLIALLVKHSGDSGNNSTKMNLLNKILGIVTGCLLLDQEVRGTEFHHLPYQRIYIILFLELNQPEPLLETINFQVLTSYCHVMHLIRPTKAPAFAYAWLELISHRVFIGRILALTPQQKGWNMYSQLLIDLFKFLAPFLRNAEMAKPVTMLYKGTLRVLLVLLHDFPEFLCDYHYAFCDVIPSNCIQMRNLILSAFPRNMRLPDPFTPNLRVEVLSEITVPPRIVANYAQMITPLSFKKDLDSYLKQRAPVTFLSDLRSNLQISNEPGMSYNIPLMNALVLYVGTQAIQHIRSKGLTPNMSTIASSAHMDIFQNLGVDLDTEGRYLFLNAIANQLRYPNIHTHYFSCTLLYLFAESNTESIQEQITRVLLERLIVNRPHPWGLLITFIELIKNPSYKFWNHEFVHCAPEIEKLFESVARSCMVPKQVNPQQENDVGEALTV
ncbi:UNVERIFIED_CONTAM: hypothetical protein PYX00_001693 [Menopon gallinae]|uniref:CCR4-NOT transcription complex subunit 1 n=1 Tax=Menopon gallinae TaxID=328185 RepID=A0AAW2IF73_9NEOP